MINTVRRVVAPVIIALLGIIILNATILPVRADNGTTAEAETLPPSNFKVIGYYSGDLFDEPIDQLPTDKLTHIIYAFLIPRADGSLAPIQKPDQLRELVTQAHRDGAKVLIALGGWWGEGQELEPVFEAVAANDELRIKLVENVRQMINNYDLDGLELDWEFPYQYSIADYERLVLDLKTALHQDGKELTAALNGAWSSTEGPEPSMVLTDNCLHSFDFINVMAYDINNDEHSPLWFTETSIDYWLNRGVAAEDIVIGMPLYARPSWMQYRHLVELDPDNAFLNYVPTTPLASYYNGLNILREKTIVALSRAGGVMLFDVNEDTLDEATSVVAMINDLRIRYQGMDSQAIAQQVSIILNDRELVFNAVDGMGMPYIDENGRILIPVRKTLEAIEARLQYDALSRTVTIIKDEIEVMLPIDKNEMIINGRLSTMDSPALIRDGRTYVPLRAVLSAFGYEAEWHAGSRTAYFNRNEPPAESEPYHI